MLADGTFVRLRLFQAEVNWHNGPLGVNVLEADGTALKGMALLRGSRVTLKEIDGGPVEISLLA